MTSARLADGDLISVGPATFRLSGQDLKELHAAEAAAVAAAGAYPAPGSQAGQAPPAEPGSGAVAPASPSPAAEPVTPPAPAAASGEPLEIPYAVRWLVPDGERFANFDILNDNDSQLAYYRKFGHIYAVGIPTKKWRLVVVSDPGLLDEVAGDEEQFGVRHDHQTPFLGRDPDSVNVAELAVVGEL